MDKSLASIVSIAKTEFDGNSLMGKPFLPMVEGLPLGLVKSTETYEGYSVWGIALHVLYHKYSTIKLLGGETGLEPFPYEEADWPKVPADMSEAAWKRLLGELKTVHAAYIKAFENFDMKRWNEEIPAWKCTVGAVLETMAGHDLYHVVQLRNMGLTDPATKQLVHF
jgi:hypothetical protein